MKILGMICFCFLSTAASFAQKPTYEFSDTILANLKRETPIYKYQYAAFRLSYINEYKQTLSVWDSILDPEAKADHGDSLIVKSYRAVDARQYILEKAKNARIVIINEAHHQPMHRVFTESLLHDLRQIGFNYFGAETLTASDTNLNRRGYPVLGSGYYTRQPQYGELVRTALKEGYRVFAYEADFSKPHYDNSRTWREQEQAKNIKAILDKDSNARILIHCGYGHLAEIDFDGKGMLMGAWLKQYTGIDPFTIEQEHLTERSDSEHEEGLYRLIKVPYDAVFVDSAGNVYDEEHIYDVAVYHPPTKWVDGRPNWMFTDGRKACYVNRKIKTAYPCLVFAYYANEDHYSAVPADVIELKSKSDKKALALKKGKYNIYIKDTGGQEMHFKIKE
jgi:hypothetical protein